MYKTMKIKDRIILLVLFVTSCMGFTSCSSDDEEYGQTSQIKKIEGVWLTAPSDETGVDIKLVFNRDRKGVISSCTKGVGEYVYSKDFTYALAVTNDKISFVYTNSSEVLYIKFVSDNEIWINETGDWNKAHYVLKKDATESLSTETAQFDERELYADWRIVGVKSSANANYLPAPNGKSGIILNELKECTLYFQGQANANYTWQLKGSTVVCYDNGLLAVYIKVISIDANNAEFMISEPGKPGDTMWFKCVRVL